MSPTTLPTHHPLLTELATLINEADPIPPHLKPRAIATFHNLAAPKNHHS
ncbi:hypothetical protein [Actinosynnema sp. NPDC020468]